MRLLPFPEQSFQGVWCVAALLHLPRTDAPHVLRQVGRILTPGGLLHLTVQMGEGEGWEPAPYQPPLERFYTRYTLQELLPMLEAGGLAVESTGEEAGHRHWLWIYARKPASTR
jgi:ubiquinone/menaquinone biosynthesis C-methylase UbiE